MSQWENFVTAVKDTFDFRSSGKDEKEDDVDAIALNTFRSRISTIRDSYNPQSRYAPGFDYINWKPYGTWRREDPSHTYVMQCKGLAPYVRSVVVAACEGVEERKWEAMTYKGQERIQDRVSRAGSRENLVD